ncbi:MAG: glycosyltransferase family 2 protein [Deltaproteobacteria bacterium]|nr:glycosyltransferase family 2 protein [Deltaproteobacteria bacterium]
MDSKNISYVLITPAHNEEDFIEKTIQSVIYQTVLPKKWAIVNDGSTDGTDDIIKRYAKRHDWIEFIRLSQHTDRQFAAKVHAFNAGYERIKNSEYAIIGNLDADISFEKDYFEFLLSKFNENGKLGVAGTPFVEESFKGYDFKFANIEHVSGACQLFRRECFESIGGYKPIRGGGIDWIAVTTARMKGWKTRTFTERTCLHHRKIGTGNNSALMALFKQGRKDYFLGNHPLWEIFRTFYQMSRKPYVMGGLLLFFGFAWAGIKRTERPISKELMEFIRREQMQRLKNIFRKL